MFNAALTATQLRSGCWKDGWVMPDCSGSMRPATGLLTRKVGEHLVPSRPCAASCYYL